MKKIAVTGHRPKYLGNEYGLIGPYSNYIRAELQKIIDEHKPTHMISGMALGVDTIWAKLAVENNIPLIAAIPFTEQAKNWSTIDQNNYSHLLTKAQERYIISMTNIFTPDVYHNRDKWMVNNADLVVAVLLKKKKTSGTAFTARYAESQKVSVIYVDPNGWKI